MAMPQTGSKVMRTPFSDPQRYTSTLGDWDHSRRVAPRRRGCCWLPAPREVRAVREDVRSVGDGCRLRGRDQPGIGAPSAPVTDGVRQDRLVIESRLG